MEDPQKVNPKDIKSRAERPTGSTHIGDTDFELEDPNEIGDATWGEVATACCVHSGSEWLMILVGIVLVCFFLYFFLLGLNIMGTSAKVLGGCTAGSILGEDTNPVAALMIGILATVLMQSSSTTTSIVVALVGADAIPARQAIYMIMGANIGTSVTNTIVAMGQMGDGDQLERAFAGATVHDLFNFLTVGILFPVELITGYLFYVTEAITNGVVVEKGDKWVGPIKKIVSPVGALIIKADKKLIEKVAKSVNLPEDDEDYVTCESKYPTKCEDPDNPTKDTCKTGIISCDSKTNACPAFFQSGATLADDEVSGGVCFFISLVILVVCLIGLVTVLQKMLLGMSTRILYKATNINGYLAILVGVGITILVQSSSITTSTLTPLVGIGALRLEQMLPLTLGANIGTTITAFLASLVSGKVVSLQVALAHLLFNITGIVIFYPIPFMRNIPISGARALGKATRLWRGFPIVYILTLFIALPLILFGITTLFNNGSLAFTVLGAMLVGFLVVGIAYYIFWFRFRGGAAKCTECFENRQAKQAAMRNLADDLDYMKARISALAVHTGLPEDAVEEGETEELVKPSTEKYMQETARPPAAAYIGGVEDSADEESC
jgi:sodium-dependent phosphate cotransporter